MLSTDRDTCRFVKKGFFDLVMYELSSSIEMSIDDSTVRLPCSVRRDRVY